VKKNLRLLTPNPQSLPSAFTLLELLLVIVLLGILAGLASLQVAPLLSRARLERGARQVATDLQAVKMRAIAQNRSFRVTFRSDTRDYVVDKNEDGAWQRHALDSHNPGTTADALIALPPSVSITAVNSGGDVIFIPRGYVDAGITITLGTATGVEHKRVVVNLAGRVRIE
jgi:prepilin-type N-terminal cleavage/methylation domain-containing protein